MRDEVFLINDLIRMIRSNAKQIVTESGSIEFIVSDEFLEDIEYQMYLKKKVDKAKQSIADGKRHSASDFRKRYGLN